MKAFDMNCRRNAYSALLVILSLTLAFLYFCIVYSEAAKPSGCALYIDDKFACEPDTGKRVRSPIYLEAGENIKVNVKYCYSSFDFNLVLTFDEGGKYEYKISTYGSGIEGFNMNFPNVFELSPNVRFPEQLTNEELREYNISLEVAFAEEKGTKCAVSLIIRNTKTPLIDIHLSSAGEGTDIKEVKIATFIEDMTKISEISFDYGDGKTKKFSHEELEEAMTHNHLFPSTGEYTVTATVRDSEENLWEKSKSIMLEPKSEALFTASYGSLFWKTRQTAISDSISTMNVKKDTKIDFSAIESIDSLFAEIGDTNKIRFEWYFEGEETEPDSVSTKTSYVFRESGVFPVVLYLKDEGGKKIANAKMVISVSDREVDNYPKADISVPQSNEVFPITRSVKFEGYALDDRPSPVNAKWDIFNLEFGPESEKYHEYSIQSSPDAKGIVYFEKEFSTTGKRRIILYATDSSGQTSTDEIEINIQEISEYPCSDGECPPGMKCFFNKCYRIEAYPDCVESDNIPFIEDGGKITKNPLYNSIFDPDSCRDSDSENLYFDSCTEDGRIIEYSCSGAGGSPGASCTKEEPKECPYGYDVCEGGKCVSSSGVNFIWPLKGPETIIISCYGPREASEKDASLFHAGIDIRAYRGEPVLAIADGTIKEIGGSLNKVVIRHKINDKIIYSEYLHNDQVLVKPGYEVKQGEEIALAGGYQCFNPLARSPHVHLGIREEISGMAMTKLIDPLAELPMMGNFLIYKPESNCCYYWEAKQPACILGERESQEIFNLVFNYAKNEGRKALPEDVAQEFWFSYGSFSQNYKIKYGGYARLLASMGSVSCKIWDIKGINRNDIAIEIMKIYYREESGSPSFIKVYEEEKTILKNLDKIFNDFDKAWNMNCEIGIKKEEIKTLLEKRLA